jgi:hypothetical protein
MAFRRLEKLSSRWKKRDEKEGNQRNFQSDNSEESFSVSYITRLVFIVTLTFMTTACEWCHLWAEYVYLANYMLFINPGSKCGAERG